MCLGSVCQTREAPVSHQHGRGKQLLYAYIEFVIHIHIESHPVVSLKTTKEKTERISHIVEDSTCHAHIELTSFYFVLLFQLFPSGVSEV